MLCGKSQISSWLSIVLLIGSLTLRVPFAVSAEQDSSMIVSRIAFGSCANQQQPCPAWRTIADYRPDLFILLGDNIYADVVEGRLVPATPQRLADAYQQLAALPDFVRLRNQTKILATWDDHDYGNNDAGVEWEHKNVAAKLFHDFMGTPPNSPLRQQAGIYSSNICGPPGRRVQIILLDTRYFRSPLEQVAQPMPGFRARPYVPRTDSEATLLGEDQWIWLEEQLRKPADLRLIGSSIQVLCDQHPFEKWDNFPRERQRLYELIRQCEASGVILLSGDRHHGEISVDPAAVGYPLYDITASGLNQADDRWKQLEESRYRVAGLAYGDHFGAVEIDWEQSDPLVSMQLRWVDGQVAVQARIPLSLLDAPKRPLPLAPGVLSGEQAIARLEGDEVEVQFAVQGGRVIGDGARILLNSLKEYQSERNFTVVLNASAITDSSFGRSTGEPVDPAKIIGRTIRAKGKISIYRGAKQVVIDSPNQWMIVDAPK